MSLDLNRKIVTKNAFRITKKRNFTALRIRVPGGHISAELMRCVADLSDKYGNGTIHITTRQGFEIPEIPFERMPEVNREISYLIQKLIIDTGVEIQCPELGYPAAGMRNISACIGSRVCPFANTDTTLLAQKLEAVMYPDDLHFKIAVTGCPNDCIKGHLQDFGVMAICIPQYDYDQCFGCDACVKNCRRKVTGALEMHNGKVVRDERRCIGCGECVRSCPSFAWSRKEGNYYRLLIMGRTGKKNPRIAMPFINNATEDVIIKVIHNTKRYVHKHILKCLPKQHIGYIVDRTGYQVFKNEVLESVELNIEATVAKMIQWPGYNTLNDFNLYKIT